MSSEALLVVGLGNPGPKYERTRHNIGFDAAEELAERHGGNFSAHKRTNADVAEINIRGRKVIVAKPRTFMNVSGGAVKALANYFKISPANIVVIHDELDMAFGEVRLRRGGGDHGHNGLRDTTKALGTKEYYRLSCGVGRPPVGMALPPESGGDQLRFVRPLEREPPAAGAGRPGHADLAEPHQVLGNKGVQPCHVYVWAPIGHLGAGELDPKPLHAQGAGKATIS